MGVIKIAPHGRNRDIFAPLGHHLALLYFTYAPFGVEYHNGGAGDITKALQRSLAGIAAGGGQNDGLAVIAQQLLCPGDEIGQQRKRNILKGAGRPVEQLQHMVFPRPDQWGHLRGVKFTVGRLDHRAQHFGGVIRQQPAQHRFRHFREVLLQHFGGVKRQGGGVAQVQPAIRGDAAQHRFGRGSGKTVITGTVISHRGLLFRSERRGQVLFLAISYDILYSTKIQVLFVEIQPFLHKRHFCRRNKR